MSNRDGGVNCEIREVRIFTLQSRCYRDSSPTMGAYRCDTVNSKTHAKRG
jgi:hypothetical protein